jgi:hypothetical protein
MGRNEQGVLTRQVLAAITAANNTTNCISTMIKQTFNQSKSLLWNN